MQMQCKSVGLFSIQIIDGDLPDLSLLVADFVIQRLFLENRERFRDSLGTNKLKLYDLFGIKEAGNLSLFLHFVPDFCISCQRSFKLQGGRYNLKHAFSACTISEQSLSSTSIIKSKG